MLLLLVATMGFGPCDEVQLNDANVVTAADLGVQPDAAKPSEVVGWPMRGHDARHSGLSPYNGPQTPTKKWTFAADDAANAGTVIGPDGTIYAGDSGHLFALNPDGTKKWAFPSALCEPAVGSDGTVYCGSGDGKVYAINSDGTQKWMFAASGQLSPPSIGSDGTLYIGTTDKKLYALNPDGTQKWAFQTKHFVTAPPAIASDGTLYLGDAPDLDSSSPYLLYALNPDGTQKWTFSVIASQVTLGADGTLYFGADDGKLYALSASGNKKWTFDTGPGGSVAGPTIGPTGTLYVSAFASHGFYAVNPDGTKKWSISAGTDYFAWSAIGHDGTIYVGFGVGSPASAYDLYALNPADGTRTWRFATGVDGKPGSDVGIPAIGSDGTLYFSCDDTNIYAVGP